jgi:hypothetical protein
VTIESFSDVRAALKQVAGQLRDAGVDYLLAGGLACWARGGPPTEHDVDLVMTDEHADKAMVVLEDAGLRTARPPEGWLYKAWVDDVLVDLIFGPSGPDTPEQLMARADVMSVEAVDMHVMTATDVLVTKLSAMHEHHLDYEGCLSIARALREQIDWTAVSAGTAGSPYAKGFFTLVDALGVSGPAAATRSTTA